MWIDFIVNGFFCILEIIWLSLKISLYGINVIYVLYHNMLFFGFGSPIVFPNIFSVKWCNNSKKLCHFRFHFLNENAYCKVHASSTELFWEPKSQRYDKPLVLQISLRDCVQEIQNSNPAKCFTEKESHGQLNFRHFVFNIPLREGQCMLAYETSEESCPQDSAERSMFHFV